MKVEFPIFGRNGLESYFAELSPCCQEMRTRSEWVLVPSLAPEGFGYPKFFCEACGYKVEVGTHVIDAKCIAGLELFWNEGLKSKGR